MAGDNTSFVLIAINDAATIPMKNQLQNDDVKALVMHTSFLDLGENNQKVDLSALRTTACVSLVLAARLPLAGIDTCPLSVLILAQLLFLLPPLR
jgi:hypothetical protein